VTLVGNLGADAEKRFCHLVARLKIFVWQHLRSGKPDQRERAMNTMSGIVSCYSIALLKCQRNIDIKEDICGRDWTRTNAPHNAKVLFAGESRY
jgi:hypothetical protein